MSELSDPSTPWPLVPRRVRLAGIAAAIACLACLGMVLFEYLTLIGLWPPRRTDVAAAVGIVAGLELAKRAARWSWVEPRLRNLFGGVTARAEAFAEWVLAGNRPTIAVSALVAIVLASWAPHYLTWPYWTDHDVIATLALGWDQGRLPWRDQFGFQFPGEIELYWVLGRVFGWGWSLPFYAADLALLGALLTTVAVSCRACLGRWLPGLTACLSIIGYYVMLSFTLSGQRDWHAAELVAMSLMLLTLGGPWWTWIASSLLYAVAMAIRPHAVVFLPAIGLALFFPPRGASAGWKGALIWLIGAGLGFLAMFSPVLLGGLLDDFLRALDTVSHSGEFYGGGSLARSWKLFAGELQDTWTLTLGAMLAGLTWLGPSQASRRLAAIMLVVNVCVLLYRPMHPVDHNYLTQPLALFQALAVVVIADAVTCDFAATRFTVLVRLATLVLLFDLALPWYSPHCSFPAVLPAIQSLATRTAPAESPPGSIRSFPDTRALGSAYTWNNYVLALDYLRDHTGPTTPLANLLTHFPYPSMNAMVGRVSPLPIETISLVSWFPDIDFDPRIAHALEASPDAVVVCDAEYVEGNLGRRLKLTRETLDRCYIPIVRFGEIQIRRRAPRDED